MSKSIQKLSAGLKSQPTKLFQVNNAEVKLYLLVAYGLDGRAFYKNEPTGHILELYKDDDIPVGYYEHEIEAISAALDHSQRWLAYHEGRIAELRKKKV